MPYRHNLFILSQILGLLLLVTTPLLSQTSTTQPPPLEPRGMIEAQSMKCDGRTDDTAAFNWVIASAVRGNGPSEAPIELQTVRLPNGKCRFASAPKHIPAGIKILGNSNRSGTWLIADYNEQNPENGFLTWDGSFPATGSGSGGGLEHVHISKGSGKIGGTAIKLIGYDDAHRPAFMLFNDIYINAVFGAAGYWDHHFIADGTCCSTKGSNGVRDIILTNFHFGQSQPPKEGDSVVLRNAVHFYMSNGLIFTSQKGGIHVTGIDEAENHSSNDVLISNVSVEGSLIFDDVIGATFNGWLAGSLSTTPTARKCFISGIVEGVVNNAGGCGLTTDKAMFIPDALTSRSDDLAGQLKMNKGSASYTFKRRLPKPPVCIASDADSQSPVRVTTTESMLIIGGHGDDKVAYLCIAKE